MTDKKFTDEEIINALTKYLIAATNGYSAHLENGGRIDENQEQYIETLTEIINLINRQKAEIERLEEEVSNTRRKALLEASSKFAGHSNYHGDTILCKLICMAEGQEVGTAIPLDISETKAEAYKEFADRLKLHSYIMSDESQTGIINRYSVVTVNQIDNLLKEMIGEEIL